MDKMGEISIVGGDEEIITGEGRGKSELFEDRIASRNQSLACLVRRKR